MPEVILVDPQSDWPDRFRIEAERLLKLLSGSVRSIEHVGSTAVPGLPAKPTIDMMGDSPCVAVAEACVPSLEAAGYAYVPDVDKDWPDRRFFHRSEGTDRLFQLHLVPRASRFWNDYLRFRNALRENPDHVRDYANLKERLAAEFRDDVAGYTRAKSDFVRHVLRSGAA